MDKWLQTAESEKGKENPEAMVEELLFNEEGNKFEWKTRTQVALTPTTQHPKIQTGIKKLIENARGGRG